MIMNIQSFLLASLLVVAVSPVAARGLTKHFSRRDFRLPLEVVPVSYKIHLTPFLENSTFDGRVEIVTSASAGDLSSITLHVHPNVTVKTASVLVHGEPRAVRQPLPSSNETNDFFVLALDEPISGQAAGSGGVVLIMEYSGVLNNNMEGFYISSYVDADGHTEHLAATHFEPTSARMAFPCFDEPALKARFELTVTVPSGYSALSNTPTIGPPTTDELGRSVLRFQQTPPMSTYLVAVVVSKFDSTPSTSTSQNKVWSRPNARSQRDYAAHIAASIMDALVNFTGLPYETGNITKMDNVAVPDFRPGAMENWGLVTYRQLVLLADETETPFASKKSIATTIAHEYSHQFFGNIVSPAWWNVIWLSEGFASYFQYKLLSMVEPTWRMKEDFVLNNVHIAMKTDSMVGQKEMTLEEDKTVIGGFDLIAYKKGGSVISMTEHVLGTETFRAGLKNYLKKMYLKAAKEDDLFDALAESAGSLQLDGFTLREYLKSWTNYEGYPVLTVTRDYDAGTATVMQERFLTYDTTPSQPKWITPVNWATNSKEFDDTKPTAWLRTTETLHIPTTGKELFNASSWIVVNNGKTGFYRVNYDAENWRLLSRQLLEDPSVFPAVTQAQLLDDAFALALAGKLNYTVALELTRYLKDHDDVIPLITAWNELTFIMNRLSRSSYYPYYKSYMSQLMSRKLMKILDAADANSVSEDDKLFLHEVWQFSPEILDNVTQKVAALGSKDVPADQRYLVYCVRIRVGDRQVWEDYWQRYLTTNIESEKEVILKALSCSQDHDILHQYLLKTTVSDSGLRMQDFSHVGSVVCKNSMAFDVAIKFFEEQTASGSPPEITYNILEPLEEKVVDEDQAKKLVSLREKLGYKTSKGVDMKLKWIKDHEETVGQWFKEHSSATAA